MDYIDLKYFQLIHPNATYKGNRCGVQCDICGDSKSRKSLQRLELYEKNGNGTFLKCFNCGYSSNMLGYIKHYHPNYLSAYKSEKGMASLKKLTSSKDNKSGLPSEVSSFLDIPMTPLPTTIIEIPPYAGLVPVFGETKKYIESRGVSSQGFYTPHHKYVSTPDGKCLDYKDFIIYPLQNWNGFYARHIYEKVFKTYIYQGNKYLDHVVNKFAPVYIFEGIFDALSSGINNYIVMMGADLPADLPYKNLIFCYDNDKTGISKALKQLELGHKVVYLKDYTEKDLNEIMLKYSFTLEQMKELINNNIIEGILGIVTLKTRKVRCII